MRSRSPHFFTRSEGPLVAALEAEKLGTAKRVEDCLQYRWPNGSGVGAQMPTVEQCRTYAAEHKLLGADPRISARRSAVHKNISRSWAALANQLESLAIIVKSEGK